MHYLVVNPVAGRGRAKRLLGEVEAAFAERSLPLTVLTTQSTDHAKKLVRGLPSNATLLVLGGDGTLHGIAAECVYTKRTIGILPAGSGDDFAFALGIPRHNLSAALNIVFAGQTRLVDTGKVNGHTFINAFGVGFDADVAYGLQHAPLLLKDRAAYLYSVFHTLRKLAVEHVRVEVDGASVFRGQALLVTTQNGPRTGGSFPFAPLASPSDGLFDIVIAGHFNRRGTLSILPRVMQGSHLGHPKVSHFQGRTVDLYWATPRLGHMEGELVEPNKHFSIEIKPRSLKVFAAH